MVFHNFSLAVLGEDEPMNLRWGAVKDNEICSKVDVFCFGHLVFEVHPAVHPPFTEYPACARSPVRGGMQRGRGRLLTWLTVIQHVKCCRIINRKCCSWHSVGIVGVELKVRTKGTHWGFICTKGVKKTRKSEWVGPCRGLHCGEGLIPEWGGLGRMCSQAPKWWPFTWYRWKGTLLPGHSVSVRKRRVKWVSGWKALLCGVQDWGLRCLFFCYQVIFM